MEDVATAVRLGSQRFLARAQEVYDLEADKFELYFLHNIASPRVAPDATTARLDGGPGAREEPAEDEADLDEEIDALSRAPASFFFFFAAAGPKALKK